MPNITVSLTDTENKALEYAAVSVQDWIDIAATNRARIAKDEIIQKLVAHCNANSVALAVGEDAQVTQAYDLGVVDTAANVQAALEEANGE
jgi:phosphoribosylaminoimidazole (AIR) synthetase